jgi:hypothetical protein
MLAAAFAHVFGIVELPRGHYLYFGSWRVYASGYPLGIISLAFIGLSIRALVILRTHRQLIWWFFCCTLMVLYQAWLPVFPVLLDPRLPFPTPFSSIGEILGLLSIPSLGIIGFQLIKLCRGQNARTKRILIIQVLLYLLYPFIYLLCVVDFFL